MRNSLVRLICLGVLGSLGLSGGFCRIFYRFLGIGFKLHAIVLGQEEFRMSSLLCFFFVETHKGMKCRSSKSD